MGCTWFKQIVLAGFLLVLPSIHLINGVDSAMLLRCSCGICQGASSNNQGVCCEGVDIT